MRPIDADALIHEIRETTIQPEWCKILTETVIRNQSTIDAVPVVHGHWKYDNQYHWYRACCSECGYCRVTDVEADRWNEWKYCPNCGAKMDGDRDEPAKRL